MGRRGRRGGAALPKQYTSTVEEALRRCSLDPAFRACMLIENGISEAVQFFHIDALSSMVGMKVDFDMQLTLVASSLYRMMAQRMGREYSHCQAKTVFR